MIETVGPYRILRLLGAGGMGEVYLAEDDRLGRQVALKVLSRHQAGDEEHQRRLLREAQAIAQLDHPNICTVFEIGQWERGTFIAMQAVEGHDLAELMTEGRFTLGEVLDIGIQAAEALTEAHGKGILHRDLKPQNLMLTMKGQVKVLDFGLAKPLDPQAIDLDATASRTGLTIGTVPYMSPEQVRGEHLDGRSDLFSLGLVLYELATGHRAFKADSAVEVMAAILRESPPQMREDGELLHPGLRSLLARLLEKERERRTPDAARLKQELLDLRRSLSSLGSLQDLPTSPPTPWIRLRRAARRLPKWALAAGLGGALLGAAATFGLFSRNQAIESLAVLPIVNETGDPSVDYAADGLTEDLIQRLSPTPHLRVIARGSVQRFKGQPVDPKAVASELGVGSLLLGRLVRREGGIHLSLELIDARDQRRIWGGQLPRPIEDLQLVESTVTSEVARTLGLKQSKPRPRVDREAYDLYLKGRYFADRYTPGDVERGFQCFDQALRRDPSFALAHVGKANAYWGLSTTFRPAGEVMPKALVEAQMALDLDAELAEAYTIRGMARAVVDRDPKAAEADLRRAIALHPGTAAPHLTYAYFLTYTGRFPEAFASLERGMDRDPSSLNALGFLATAHIFAGQYEQAVAVTRRMKRLEPGFWWASFLESVALFYQGEREAALREVEVAATSGSPFALAWKGYYLGHMGRTREAQAVQTQLKRLSADPTTPVTHTCFALVHLGLGETDRALDELELAVKTHEEDAVALRTYPAFHEIQGHPRFKALLALVEGAG